MSRKNSFGKVVFPFLVGNFMSRNRNCFFGRHFVIVYPIFDFFAVFWFFWITLSVARILPPNLFGKVLFWVRVHRDPPLTTNGSAEGLDHFTLDGKFNIKTRHYSCGEYLGILKWKSPLLTWTLRHNRKHVIYYILFLICRSVLTDTVQWIMWGS